MASKKKRDAAARSPERGAAGRRVEPAPPRTWPDVPLWLAVFVFIVSRTGVFLFTPQVSDTGTYLKMAVWGIDLGQTPYHDYEIEYPPLAWWTIAAPRLLSAPLPLRPTPENINRSLAEYASGFRTEMLVYDAAAFALFVAILRRRRPQRYGWIAVGYIAASTLLAHLLLDRLDVGLLLLVLACIYFWLRSLDDARPTLTWAAAYVVLGFGVSYKVIPGIIAPFLLLAEFNSRERTRRLLLAMAALTAGVVLPFAIQYWFSGPAVLTFFKRHADRPLQIESVYASLMMVLSLFGPAIATDRSAGSLNLVGDLAAPMKIASTVCIAVLLLGLGIWALRRHGSRLGAYRMACFAIPAAVAAAKVFSPQYLIWALPLCLLLGAEVLPDRPRTIAALLVLVILITGMTTWIFPYNYFSNRSRFGLVPGLSPVACTVLVLRNAIYIGLLAWLGRALWRTPNSNPAPAAVHPRSGASRSAA